MRDFIVYTSDIQQLKGKGTEYLLAKDGTVIAKFIDGQFPVTPVVDGECQTAEAA